jgi:hypothetical protein
MDLKSKILQASSSPRELELLYRQNPDQFSEILPELIDQNPDSLVFQVWHERLCFPEPEKTEILEKDAGRTEFIKGISITISLILIAGTIIKLPELFPYTFYSSFFYSKILPATVILSLATYFLLQKSLPRKHLIIIVSLATVSIVYLIFLPEYHSDTIQLSLLHMPFFFWSLLGLSFVGENWRDLSKRLDYIRYNGEVLIYATMLLIGGVILILITEALFSLIKIPSFAFQKFMNDYVPVYGLVASPIVATLLIRV